METSMLAMFGLGHWELIIVLVFALLLFGKRLPEVARNLGKGIVEFKKGIKGVEDDINQEAVQAPPPTYHDDQATYHDEQDVEDRLNCEEEEEAAKKAESSSPSSKGTED